MRLDYQNLAPEAARHLFDISAAIQRSRLDPVARELSAVRISQINGCAHCIAVHWQKAAAAGASERQLQLLPVFEETVRQQQNLYDPTTVTALRIAERLTVSPRDGVPDLLWSTAVQQLGDETLMWLVHHVMLMNAWNRLSIALEIPPPRSGV